MKLLFAVVAVNRGKITNVGNFEFFPHGTDFCSVFHDLEATCLSCSAFIILIRTCADEHFTNKSLQL